MFSQFYILSPRGDCLITKDYRGDAPRGSAEIFFRHATSLHLVPSPRPPSSLPGSSSSMHASSSLAGAAGAAAAGGVPDMTAGIRPIASLAGVGRHISSSSSSSGSSGSSKNAMRSSAGSDEKGGEEREATTVIGDSVTGGGGGGDGAAAAIAETTAGTAGAGAGGAAPMKVGGVYGGAVSAKRTRGGGMGKGLADRRGVAGTAITRKKDPAPIFCVNGMTFAFLRRSGLFFVLTTQQSPSPTLLIELLHRLTKVIQDFCGVLNEESIRKNFVLIYELLHEMADCGYPQLTSTESLKSSIYSEALLVEAPPPIKQTFGGSLPTLSTASGPKTIPSNASHRPVGICSSGSGTKPSTGFRVRSGLAAAGRLALSGASGGLHSAGGGLGAAGGGIFSAATGGSSANTRRSEIFVDILERINVVLNARGELLHASLDGSIQMKSFLDGPCRLRLALNEDLFFSGQAAEDVAAAAARNTPGGADAAVSRQVAAAAAAAAAGGGACIVDACNFHECVDLSDFVPPHRVLSFLPPDGEFILMNYRVAHCAAIPFRIYPVLDYKPGSTKGELVVRIRADAPEQTTAASVMVSVPLAKTVVACSVDTPSGPVQAQEYIPAEKRISWSIRRFHCAGEMVMRARFTTSTPAPATPTFRKEFGPISLTFEIPMYNVSNLQVRYLRAAEKCGGGNPFRWVRYVTQSSSYICRV